MGKTSKQTQSVKLPPELQAAANRNLQLAAQIGALPAMNNFGPTVAAANPMQQASMRQANMAADAFGLPSTQNLGLPTAVTTPGGYAGYSTRPVYDAAMGGLTQAQRDLLAQFSYNPQTGAPPGNPSVGASDLLSVLGPRPSTGGPTPGAGKGGMIEDVMRRGSPGNTRLNDVLK